MIPFETAERVVAARDFTKEKNARVLLDLLQVNTHYRFVTRSVNGNWKQVTQLYAKRFEKNWDRLYIKGAAKKMLNEAELRRHHWRDRSWCIPQDGNIHVQVFSNKKLVWEGRL